MQSGKKEGEKLLVLADMLFGLKLFYYLLYVALSIDSKTSTKAEANVKLKLSVFHKPKAHGLWQHKTTLIIELCICRSAEKERAHTPIFPIFPQFTTDILTSQQFCKIPSKQSSIYGTEAPQPNEVSKYIFKVEISGKANSSVRQKDKIQLIY